MVELYKQFEWKRQFLALLSMWYRTLELYGPELSHNLLKNHGLSSSDLRRIEKVLDVYIYMNPESVDIQDLRLKSKTCALLSFERLKSPTETAEFEFSLHATMLPDLYEHGLARSELPDMRLWLLTYLENLLLLALSIDEFYQAELILEKLAYLHTQHPEECYLALRFKSYIQQYPHFLRNPEIDRAFNLFRLSEDSFEVEALRERLLLCISSEDVLQLFVSDLLANIPAYTARWILLERSEQYTLERLSIEMRGCMGDCLAKKLLDAQSATPGTGQRSSASTPKSALQSAELSKFTIVQQRQAAIEDVENSLKQLLKAAAFEWNGW